MQAHLSSLMASMWADPELARNFGAHVREHAAEGFERPEPVSMLAEYIRAEQALGRIRGDVDAVEAAAAVVSVPFASGMEHALSAQFSAPGGLPAPEDFPAPAAAALDILARGLAPSPDDGVR